MSRYAIVEIHTEEFKFSAGHFMIFSSTERESMHGHDYQISATLHSRYHSNGMGFDCRIYKRKLKAMCQLLDYRFLLPAESTFLRLEEASDQWICHLGTECFSFLKKDTVILPVANVTLEELSHWFLSQLTEDLATLTEHGIESIKLKVSNGRGDSGAALWAHPLKRTTNAIAETIASHSA